MSELSELDLVREVVEQELDNYAFYGADAELFFQRETHVINEVVAMLGTTILEVPEANFEQQMIIHNAIRKVIEKLLNQQ